MRYRYVEAKHIAGDIDTYKQNISKTVFAFYKPNTVTRVNGGFCNRKREKKEKNMYMMW
jgi:hypothetical protein